MKFDQSSDFPPQSKSRGAVAEVCFGYDTSELFPGEVVRDDLAAPWVTIIRLADGRHVLATECQYRVIS